MRPGLGVMINMLFGDRGQKFLQDAIGKTIKNAELKLDALRIEFEDGTGIKVSDAGQSCCERRYMRTDDDLTLYQGSQLVSMEVRDGTPVSGQYEDHEIQFLDVITSKGTFQMISHNEHNGYYGGFWIAVSEWNPSKPLETNED